MIDYEDLECEKMPALFGSKNCRKWMMRTGNYEWWVTNKSKNNKTKNKTK